MALRLTIVISAFSVAGAACASKSNVETPKPQTNASAAATLGIPPGQLPPSGECRLWVPGVAPGKQQQSRTCTGIVRAAPANSWILYRPTKDPMMVHVRELGRPAESSMITIRVFDAGTGRFVRDERQHLRESFDKEERPQQAPAEQEPERNRGRERRT